MKSLPIILILASFSITSYAQLTKNGTKAILDYHNNLRSSIAKGTYNANGTAKPPATNMLKLVWDASVAKSAQAYADKCPSGHSKLPGLGENLYWLRGTMKFGDLDNYGVPASKLWAEEFQKFGWKTNKMDKALFATGIGHATQMAWAETKSIGCGAKHCPKDAKGRNVLVVVCQYKGPGNYMGQEIYKSGTTCSACPAKTKCEKSTGLCV